MPITYRKATLDDLERLSAFNLEVCGANVPPAFWKWKFLHAPEGRSGVVVAEADGRIVGRIGVLVVDALVDGEQVPVLQAVDLDVLESHRRSGVFFRLEEFAQKRFARAFDFGIAIDLTLKLSTGLLQFAKAGEIRKLVKVIDPVPYAERKARLPPALSRLSGVGFGAWASALAGRRLRKFQVRLVNTFDSRFDALWQRAHKSRIMVAKHAAYLNWRYAQCPAVPYQILAVEKAGELVGFTVVHALERGLRYGILDDMVWAADCPEAAAAVVHAAVKGLADLRVAAIVAWTPEHDPLSGPMLEIGFRQRRTPHYWMVRPAGRQYPPGFLEGIENWSYTIGDSDYWLFPRQR